MRIKPSFIYTFKVEAGAEIRMSQVHCKTAIKGAKQGWEALNFTINKLLSSQDFLQWMRKITLRIGRR
jgi:hypothetical protein